MSSFLSHRHLLLAATTTVCIGVSVYIARKYLFSKKRKPLSPEIRRLLDFETIEEEHRDEEQIREHFELACTAARELGNISTENQLLLYGLFKTATVGKCPEDPPSVIDLTATAKYNAWQKFSHMSTSKSMQQYITLVAAYGSDPEICEGDASPQDLQSIGASQSRPKVIEVPDSLYTDAVENKIDAVREALQKDDRLANKPDETGLTLLHYACDREHLELAKMLIEDFGADVNCQDEIGNTGLHSAAYLDSKPLIELLISHNGDINLANHDGETPQQILGV